MTKISKEIISVVFQNQSNAGKLRQVFLMSPSFSVAHKYEVPDQMSRSDNWNMAKGYHRIVDSTEAQWISSRIEVPRITVYKRYLAFKGKFLRLGEKNDKREKLLSSAMTTNMKLFANSA